MGLGQPPPSVFTEFKLSARRAALVQRILKQEHPPLPPAPLPEPLYTPGGAAGRAMLALHSFNQHMTNEGWLLQEGLREAGYALYGFGYAGACGRVDAPGIVEHADAGTLIIQDKREWEPGCSGCFEPRAQFQGVSTVAADPRVYRVTILKDLLFHRARTRQFHVDLNPHLIVHYYHPALIRWLAPWLDGVPKVRTWHAIDAQRRPSWVSGARRGRALLSGAVNGNVYPMRAQLAAWIKRGQLPGVEQLKHPGYGLHGDHSTDYLQTLARYKVAICTSSVMGFALRKLIEATLAGCRVLTDLPVGDYFPGIDGNFVRIASDAPRMKIVNTLNTMVAGWDETTQREFADRAAELYDYRRVYQRLADDIEQARQQHQTRTQQHEGTVRS